MALYDADGKKIKTLKQKDGVLTEPVYERFEYPSGGTGTRLFLAPGRPVPEDSDDLLKAPELDAPRGS